MTDTSQTTLLRVAAFLVDALSISLILILPASAVSYGMAWIGGSARAIQVVWWVALAVLVFAILLRDGFRGRSLGKQILGLKTMTPAGRGCGYVRSVIRNIPLVVPVWNLIELTLVLAGKARTGDRIARTTVTEE
ncbi:MAG: RDD family protein [Thermoanaerobaculia bacterium]